ncbi:MAG TPA: glycosyltransferase [Burkholderiales bacterium]|nr:glycosyltransferase [Burkholderiales bacterium]
MNESTIWVGLPAYNEEPAIPALFERFLALFPERTMPYRIVLYDDGSTDGTAAAARAWRERLNVEVIGCAENLGLGQGLRSLLAHAAHRGRPQDILFVMDCDDTHDPRQIPGMIAALEENRCDIVIASRYRRGARVEGVAAHRRLLSAGAALVFRLLHPCRGVLDYTCGFRGYRVGLLQRALAHYGAGLVRERGFAATVELLLKLDRLGARACEVPLELRYDLKKGASKMDIGATTARLLINLIGWRFRGLE